MTTKTLDWYGSNTGLITLEFTREQLNSIPLHGQCIDEVLELRKIPEIAEQLQKIDPEALREDLDVYGCWDDEELKSHDDNLNRLLWIATGEVQEGLN